MLKFISIALLVCGSAAQDPLVPDGFKDGDLLPVDPNDEFIDFFGDPAADGASELLMTMVQEANICVVDVIHKYDLKEEMKEFMDYVFSDEWVEIVETGTKDEFKAELAIAIDPLMSRVLGITGEDFTRTMSYELGEWIKDTSLLWIKNKGAG